MDPILSLAFLLDKGPGRYALLLGSGVSRAAGIPTGWEIVLDLIRQVASLNRADVGGDPVHWYRDAMHEEPTYSALLERLAPTPAERQSLLRRYFEPTTDERDQGLKVPTKGHRAIARMAASGYFRVIITTNFDRLLEAALEQEGIAPQVISTPDAVRGAQPLTHAPLTVVKVNGDYLDTRIRNTQGELQQYEPDLTALIDRIFDEFGLVVCGWSAEWDVGLRDAIARCPTQRFSWFWCHRGTSVPVLTQDVINQRTAASIQIADADSFFEQLETKTAALRDLRTPHPLSVAAAIATLKRYLPEERYRIRLEDFVREETERTIAQIASHDFRVDVTPTAEEVRRRVGLMEAACTQLANALAAGCYFGTTSQNRLWVLACRNLFQSAAKRHSSWFDEFRVLQGYPALFGMYASGMSALARQRFEMLVDLMNLRFQDTDGETPAIASPYFADRQYGAALVSKRLTPVSDHLFGALRDVLRPYLPDDATYDNVFCMFEYIAALQFGYITERGWAPPGRFLWRDYGEEVKRLEDQVRREGDNWGPLKAGMFGGNAEGLKTTQARLADWFGRGRWV